MRRTVLITVNSVFLIATGLWIGCIIGVGALSAPAAFQQLDGLTRGGGPVAGLVVGAALTRLNAVSIIFLSIMLAVAVFELFYRRRLATTQVLATRVLAILIGILLSLYLSQVLMPAMRSPEALLNTDAFLRMHSRYKGIAWLQVLLGALCIVLTAVSNIGPRRDGGHPRPRPD